MKNVMVAIAMHLLFAPTFAADESKTPGIADHGPRFSTEGKGWRLDQARINDPDLPRVLLIGDSILAGYFKHVAKDLEGQAYVDAWVNPHHQSEHLNKLLADVLEQGPYDFVHFNMGLHGWVEGRIKPGTFEPLTKAYVQVLKAKLPNAKLIWASSTPVTKQGSPTELEPEINPIIVEHNRMAAKVMAEMSVPVNDFYSLLVEKKQLARGDRFHWTAPAYRILADKTSQSLLQTLRSAEKKPIPDRLIVLTFDDGNKSDIRFVAPLLERLGFNATFFVNRGQADGNGPRLSWADMRELQQRGFEVANHTLNHPNLVASEADKVRSELRELTELLRQHGVSPPASMAYPGGHHDRKSLKLLSELGYQFARRGVDPEFPLTDFGGPGLFYDPFVDHPFLIPSTVVFGPDTDLNDLRNAIEGAKDGKVAVLTYHGVPDVHPHCSTSPEVFQQHMQLLKDHRCTVIAMQDLARYVDPTRRPVNPYKAIHDRFALQVGDLRCEYLVDPRGVDTGEPRFSWQLSSFRPGQKQTAYQVLVATSEENLSRNQADLWDSGKVVSDQSVHVAYQGKRLKSGQVAYWKVRAWNGPANDGRYANPTYYDQQTVAALNFIRPSDYSDSAEFQMGLLEPNDWHGSWLAHPNAKVSSPLFRKAFTIDRGIRRATVFVAGVGYSELTVNGEKVGDHVLDPGTTYYHHDQDYKIDSRVLYVTHDITPFLSDGRNAIGVMLGHGWYSAEDDVPGPPNHRLPYAESPHLRIEIQLEMKDGTTRVFASDETWRVAAGPVTYNDFSHGESYDARKESVNWDQVAFDDTTWLVPQVVEGPNGRLVSQMLEPIRVVETIQPVKVNELRAGQFIYDMGRNISGWTRIRVRGDRGTKVTLRHAGGLHADGRLDDRCNMHPTHEARQTDLYILKGEGEESWEPRFTLHGFRYVEVSGDPALFELLAVEGRMVRTDAESAGTFRCSNPLLNRIHDYVKQTFACCLQSQPQDAMDRAERVAWLGDPGMIAEDCMYNFRTAPFWTKWLEDIRDAQKPNGEVPFTCPNHWRGSFGNYSWVPVWHSSYPLFVWYLYQYYGDERILAEHFDALRSLAEFHRRKADNGILNGGLGDHMEPQTDGRSSSGPRRTPSSLTSTAYYFYEIKILAEIARVLGKDSLAGEYQTHSERIKDAFNREFFDSDSNDYGRGSQTANAVALYLGLVPQDRIMGVRENLVHNIMEEHQGHLATGIVGTNALEQVLPELGETEVMYGIATKTTFPSWGHQVVNGATTLWETWEEPTAERYSLNMKMFGSSQLFFYKHLAGIAPGSPGFQDVIIRPRVVDDLDWVEGSLETMHGRIETRWERTKTGLHLRVTIPTNTTAQIHVPTLDSQQVEIGLAGADIWSDKGYLSGGPGVLGGHQTKDAVVLQVGGGRYLFRMRKR